MQQTRIGRVQAIDSRSSRTVSRRAPPKGQYKKNTVPTAINPVSRVASPSTTETRDRFKRRARSRERRTNPD